MAYRTCGRSTVFMVHSHWDRVLIAFIICKIVKIQNSKVTHLNFISVKFMSHTVMIVINRIMPCFHNVRKLLERKTRESVRKLTWLQCRKGCAVCFLVLVFDPCGNIQYSIPTYYEPLESLSCPECHVRLVLRDLGQGLKIYQKSATRS